ncbi:MAG: exo-alpha-sialidase [Pirellulales bacterium]|nr:exo-alpha-sialidase [Pirellulales bacterium]
MVVTSAWPDWSGRESPWRHDGLAFASRDGGETWGELVQVVRQDHPSLGAFEQALTRLSDGRVLAICWNYDIAQSRSLSNRIAFSNDGFAFGACRDAPLKGETCRVLGLPSNRVLAVYRRVDRPGLWAQLARIDGDQWIPKADLQLWTGSPSYGDAADLDGGVAKMSSLRFGCPTVVHLSNGEAFVAFWCFEDCISVIRWFRLAIQAE